MLSRSSVTCLLAVVIQLSVLKTAEAGPFLDWLFGGRRTEPAYPIGAPVPLGSGYGAAYSPGSYAAGTVSGYVPGGYGGYGFAPSYAASYGPSYTSGMPTGYGNYYGMAMPAVGPSGAGYPTAIPSGITAATAPAQVFPGMPQMPQPMSFVPNYDSRALRAPVTYYRPLMTTDPNTGAQVVSMAPCTSYQYLTQRVPTFGQSALYGSYQVPALAPQLRTIPTYSLPSGGVPLAQSVPSTSLPPTTLGYSPYTTYQPGLPIPQNNPVAPAVSPGYSTTPMSSSPYYPSANGGSTGTIYSNTSPYSNPAPGYSNSVPGLVAPQSAPYTNTPAYSTPTYPSNQGVPTQIAPGQLAPGQLAPGNLVVPGNQIVPGNDPADTVPSLPPYNGMRPQLRSIVPDAGGYGNESASTSKSSRETGSSLDSSRDFPVMSPIPAPEGLEKPRWNPGLLREGDMTALRPVSRPNDENLKSNQSNASPSHIALVSNDENRRQPYLQIPAGQSKKIVWAKFDLPNESQTVIPRSAPAQTTRSRYDSSGWKASR